VVEESNLDLKTSKVWLVTGAGRGLGAEIAKAALRSGDRVVATGRSKQAISALLGPDSDALFSISLDVADIDQARAAVAAAASRFHGIDVLVNNAGYGHMGFFEELTSQDVHAQFATNLFGLMDMCRCVIPLMRVARRGRIFNLSSLGGLIGAQLGSIYCASKFAVEGFSESLAKEIAPLGIFVTLIEPGPFRTDFLKPESFRFAEGRLPDYDERRFTLRSAFEARNGQQPGDPAKLAGAMVELARHPAPPMRFLAGSVALSAAKDKLSSAVREIDKWSRLTLSTDGDFASTSIGGLLDQIK
jgi:NAD(P)-dependent dehydrogenase (short-subunit alcohol dehydrogenase family)